MGLGTAGSDSVKDESDARIESSRRLSSIDLSKSSDPEFWMVSLLYPCLYGILTNVMVAVFNLIAIKVNEFENHRTQSQYMNRLVLKVISFRFVAVFTTLYYYAFFSNLDTDASYFRMVR